MVKNRAVVSRQDGWPPQGSLLLPTLHVHHFQSLTQRRQGPGPSTACWLFLPWSSLPPHSSPCSSLRHPGPATGLGMQGWQIHCWPFSQEAFEESGQPHPILLAHGRQVLSVGHPCPGQGASKGVGGWALTWPSFMSSFPPCPLPWRWGNTWTEPQSRVATEWGPQNRQPQSSGHRAGGHRVGGPQSGGHITVRAEAPRSRHTRGFCSTWLHSPGPRLRTQPHADPVVAGQLHLGRVLAEDRATSPSGPTLQPSSRDQ